MSRSSDSPRTGKVRRNLKRLGIVTWLLITIVLLIQVATLVLVDWGQYKDDLIAQLQKETGGTISASQNVDISYFPPRLTISNIELEVYGQDESEKSLAQVKLIAKKAEIYFSLLNMARGYLSIENLELRDAHLAILEDIAVVEERRILSALERINDFTIDRLMITDDRVDKKEYAITDVSIESNASRDTLAVGATMVLPLMAEEARVSAIIVNASKEQAEMNIEVSQRGKVLKISGAVRHLFSNTVLDATLSGEAAVSAFKDHENKEQIISVSGKVGYANGQWSLNAIDIKDNTGFEGRLNLIEDSDQRRVFNINVSELVLAGWAQREKVSLKEFFEDIGDEISNLHIRGIDALSFTVETLHFAKQQVQNVRLEVQTNRQGVLMLTSLEAEALPARSHILLKSRDSGEGGIRTNYNFELSGMHLGSLLEWFDIPWPTSIEMHDDFFMKGTFTPSEDYSGGDIENFALKVAETELVGRGKISNTSTGPLYNLALRANGLTISVDRTSLQEIFSLGERELLAKLDSFREIDRFSGKVVLALELRDSFLGSDRVDHLSGVVRYEPGSVRLEDIKLKNESVGSVGISGMLDVRGLSPVFTMDIAFDKLHLDDPAYDAEGEKEFTPPVWSVHPMDPTILRVMGGTGKLRIKDFRYHNIKGKNLALEFYLGRDELRITNVTGMLLDSNMRADVTVFFNPISINTTFSFAPMNIAEFLGGTLGIENVERGAVSVTGGLSALGSTISHWIGSLKGTVNILGREAVWKGFDLEALYEQHDLQENIQSAQSMTRRVLAGGKTPMDHYSGTIHLLDGVMRLDNMPYRYRGIYSGIMSGTLDLVNWKADLRTEIRLRKMPLSAAIIGPINDTEARWDWKSIDAYWQKKLF